MKFGTKKSDVVEFDSSGSFDFKPYLRNFRNGDNLVRFVEEVDDWIMFYEHFTPENKSFPCTGERNSCPGCTSDNERMKKASRKYATNLQLVEQNVVLPFRIPMGLAKKLFNRAERNGSITTRDYVVMREGQGLETEYDLEQDDKRPENIEALRGKAHDLQEIFQSMYDEIWGEGTVEVDEEPAKVEKAPFDQGETEEVDEAALRAMSRKDLVALATQHSINFDEDGGKSDILDAILAQAG